MGSGIQHVKYYLRHSAPVWLYAAASHLWHVPLHIKRLLRLSPQPSLQGKVYHTITTDEVSYQLLLNEDNGLVDQTIFRSGEWEPRVTQKIMELLSPGAVFVDVGANIGYYSLLASKVVGPEGRVVACEPIASLGQQLKLSVEKNQATNITVVPQACGEQASELSIAKYDYNIGKSSLLDSGANDLVEETVSVTTLDQLLADYDRVDVIKIDVEGYEPYVLFGAEQTLARHQPAVLFEYNPKRLHAQISTAKALEERLFTFLQQAGYQFWSIKGETIEDWRSFSRRQQQIGSYVELVCLPLQT